MRYLLIVMVVVGTATARADAFAFKDIEGFEKCLQLDHLVESVTTPDGVQSRFLAPLEIQLRCIEAAEKLLAPAKNKDKLMSFVGAVKRLSAPENSLGLVSLVVDLAVASCNDSEIYDVLVRALEHNGDAYVVRSTAIVKRCLKDKAFRKDFTDELASSDTNLAAHACEILRDEKLVTSCKRSKP